MELRQIVFLLAFITMTVAIDLFLYRWIKSLSLQSTKWGRYLSLFLFRIIPGLLITGFLLFPIVARFIPPGFFMNYIHHLTGMFFLFYIPKIELILFIFIETVILFVIRWFRRLILRRKLEEKTINNRLSFINKIGVGFATFVFFLVAYGISFGRFDFIIRTEVVISEKLPDSFNGFKIAQVSDFHIGSFLHHEEEVEIAVDKINETDPDLILLTGDIVNNTAEELEHFLPVLSKMKAKYGIYSVLGNHDYGDYVPWNTPQEKRANIEKIIQLQESIGIRVLMNESELLILENDTLAIIGVENWGLPPFPQFGKLGVALTDVKDNHFQILLSHDPTHWGAEVLDKTNVDLTLSGHTHGAQFGVEVAGFRWSPVNFRYKYWGGLFKEGEQYLNVNTGIGFIGFPGRIGMPPEVTLIELKNLINNTIKSIL